MEAGSVVRRSFPRLISTSTHLQAIPLFSPPPPLPSAYNSSPAHLSIPTPVRTQPPPTRVSHLRYVVVIVTLLLAPRRQELPAPRCCSCCCCRFPLPFGCQQARLHSSTKPIHHVFRPDHCLHQGRPRRPWPLRESSPLSRGESPASHPRKRNTPRSMLTTSPDPTVPGHQDPLCHLRLRPDPPDPRGCPRRGLHWRQDGPGLQEREGCPRGRWLWPAQGRQDHHLPRRHERLCRTFLPDTMSLVRG